MVKQLELELKQERSLAETMIADMVCLFISFFKCEADMLIKFTRLSIFLSINLIEYDRFKYVI